MPTVLNNLKTKLAESAYINMTHANAASTLRVPGSGTDILHDIDIGELERYMAAEGILLTLRDEAANGTSGDAQVTAVARELIALVDSVNVQQFNIHNTRAQGGLSVLLSVSMITAAQKAAITALGISQQTIWAEIGMPNGTADDVMRARTL